MAKALFYVCRAIGREFLPYVTDREIHYAWWAWYDAARAWVEGA